MASFHKEINLDPLEIKNMDLAQKQDCMSEIDSRRRLAWKYSVIFCIGTIFFIFVYSMISLLFTLRYMRLLKSIHPLFFLIPIVIFVLSLAAHSMNGNTILFTVIAYMLTGFLTIISASFVNAWISPFAFAGAVFYIRLSRVCETYDALSKEDGFPEFCSIESMSDSAKEIIERNKVKEDPLHPLTEMAIIIAQKTAEKEKNAASEAAVSDGGTENPDIKDNAEVKETAAESTDAEENISAKETVSETENSDIKDNAEVKEAADESAGAEENTEPKETADKNVSAAPKQNTGKKRKRRKKR